jgi:hypothetical protein
LGVVNYESRPFRAVAQRFLVALRSEEQKDEIHRRVSVVAERDRDEIRRVRVGKREDPDPCSVRNSRISSSVIAAALDSSSSFVDMS